MNSTGSRSGSDALPPALRDEFVVQATLGRGGFGVVFRAEQRALARPVAIKLLTEEAARDEDFARRFEDEARLGARVDHPNVVRIYAFGAGATGAYIVYELIEGESLASVLERGPLAPGRACAIARDIAAGLVALHEARIIHRDLKPANVLVGGDGRARLIDLGIARDLADRTHRTRTGVVLGSPEYMSPEQIEQGPQTGAVDVYALGATLHAMLTGRSPFAGLALGQMLHAQLYAPPSFAPKGDRLERQLGRMALECLDKDPARRPTAARLVRDLDRLASSPPAVPPAATVLSPVPPAVPPAATVLSPVLPAARASSRETALAVAVLAALAGLLLIISPRRPGQDPPAASATPAHGARPPSPATPSPAADAESTTPGRRGAFWDVWRELARHAHLFSDRAREVPRRHREALEALAGPGPEVWRFWVELGAWLRGPEGKRPPEPARASEDDVADIVASSQLEVAWRNSVRKPQLPLILSVDLLRRHPMDGRAWFLLARELEEQGDGAGARRVARTGLDRLAPHALAESHESIWKLVATAIVESRPDAREALRPFIRRIENAGTAWRGIREALGGDRAELGRSVLVEGAASGPGPDRALCELAELEASFGQHERARRLLEERLRERAPDGHVGLLLLDHHRRRADLDALRALTRRAPGWRVVETWIAAARGEPITAPVALERLPFFRHEVHACRMLALIEAGQVERAAEAAAVVRRSELSREGPVWWAALQLHAAGHGGPAPVAAIELPSPEAPRAWLLAADSATGPARDWFESRIRLARARAPGPELALIEALVRARAGQFAAALDGLPPAGARALPSGALASAAAEVALRPLLARLAGHAVTDSVVHRARALLGARWMEPLRPVALAIGDGDLARARRESVEAFLAHPDESSRILLMAHLHHLAPHDEAAIATLERAHVAARFNLCGLAVLREIGALRREATRADRK